MQMRKISYEKIKAASSITITFCKEDMLIIQVHAIFRVGLYIRNLGLGHHLEATRPHIKAEPGSLCDRSKFAFLTLSAQIASPYLMRAGFSLNAQETDSFLHRHIFS